MAFDFQTEVLKGVNLTDEQKLALGAVLADPTVSKRLEESFLRQSDYSRLAAEAKAERERAIQYYGSLEAWKAKTDAEIEAEKAALGSGRPAQLPADVLTQAKFNEELTKVQSGAIGFLTVLNDKSMEHYQEFGKRLDTAKVLKRAQDEGTNFVIAYEREIQPLREEKQKADLEVRIKREREEAVREAMANASLPTMSNPNGALTGGQPHVLDLITAKPAGEQFGWRRAMEAHVRDIHDGTVAQKANNAIF